MYRNSKSVSQLKIQFAQSMTTVPARWKQCPHCNSISLQKYGTTKKGSQRYKCNHCQKVSVITPKRANTISKKQFDDWSLFVDCSVQCFSLRKTAKVCHISPNTARLWREKLFDCVVSLYRDNRNLPTHTEENRERNDDPSAQEIETLIQEIESFYSTNPENEKQGPIRVDVGDWHLVYLKNEPRYRLWEIFVREAMSAPNELEYIKEKTLRKPKT